MKRDFIITEASKGAAITVKIVPKANRTELVGIDDDGTVKIRLMSPPIAGQANEELVGFLAEVLGIDAGGIEIVAGHDGRKKLVSLLNIDAVTVENIVRSQSGQ